MKQGTRVARCAAAFVLSLSATASAMPMMYLAGVVRDFNCEHAWPSTAPCATHPDFNISPYWNAPQTGLVRNRLGVDGKPVANFGGSYAPTITSVASFNQWYRTVPGVNTAAVSSIMLKETAPDSGRYVYADDAFFPGGAGSFDFTFELRLQFLYQPGQAFNFGSDDDLWVFIDDELVVDLGGTHGLMHGGVELDGLGFSAGSVHALSFFHAQRQHSGSALHVDLDLAGRSVPEPATLALVALALGAAAGAVCRGRAGADLRRRQLPYWPMAPAASPGG